MLHREKDGLSTYHFQKLDVPGLVHAVFTRRGGVSRGPFATLNISENVGDDWTAVAENRARVYAHLGLDAGQVVLTGQVHGNHVAVVAAGDGGRTMAQTDGLVSNVPQVALLLRFADCQPILLYDPAHQALGLIHAGWRGVALGIARRAVERMQEVYGSEPRELLAGLGPAIGPCCYTVGHRVAAAMGYALPDWHQVMAIEDEDTWRLDLSAANAQLLHAAGVYKRHIEEAGLCTACHKGEFFSHRADGGRTGRFAVVAYLESDRGEDTGTTLAGRPAAEAETTTSDSLHPPGFPAFDEMEEPVR